MNDENNEEERTVWDITPFKTTVELSDGKIRMRESSVYQGRLRVSKAINSTTGPQECAWLYIQAESRDGADVKLTPDNARELRDALNECLEEVDGDG